MSVERAMNAWLTDLEIQALKMRDEVAMDHFFATKYLYWVLLSVMLPAQKEDHFLVPLSPARHSHNLLAAMKS